MIILEGKNSALSPFTSACRGKMVNFEHFKTALESIVRIRQRLSEVSLARCTEWW